MQVIKESAARIASSTETSPMKSPESEGDKVVLLEKEIADMKKRFLSVAKKKQAEYAKRVHFPSYNQNLSTQAILVSRMCVLLACSLSCERDRIQRNSCFSRRWYSYCGAALISGGLLYKSAVDTLLIYP